MRNIFNVANHLRQGYGGQDVKVLPVPMLPITKKWEFNAELSRTKILIQFHKMRILCGTFYFGEEKILQGKNSGIRGG